jgi:Cu(I)/Ag(I) efflux system membrane fusion protein
MPVERMSHHSRRAGLAILTAVLAGSGCSPAPPPDDAHAAPSTGASRPAARAAGRVLYYRHPMNPSVTSPVPAKDEMGMDYVPVYQNERSAEGVIQLPASVVQKLAVRSAPVAFGPLPSQIRAPGIVQFDARSVTEAYVVTTGLVENLSVHSVGEGIRAGQLLFELYSPALAIVDAQYLQAVISGTPSSTNPYVNGLRTFGLTDDLIADLREKRRPVGRIPLRAGRAGVVTALNFRNGAIVPQGASVLQWTALDPVWVIIDVPASQATAVKAGGVAEVAAAGLPGRKFSARIDYVYPNVDAITRSVQARLVLQNRDGALRPNMPVSAILYGDQSEAVLHVPREAVIRDGHADRVILALGDGRFAPRDVTLGRESGDRIVVREGLTAADRVVTAGAFLLDSESNIRSGLARMTDEGRDGAAAAPAGRSP